MVRHGFTIIELLIVLVVIGLTAVLSVPRIDEWIARQQARQFIAQFVADVSRAVSLATVRQNAGGTLSAGAAVNRSAILYATEGSKMTYRILIRTAPNSGARYFGSGDSIVKKGVPPSRITLDSWSYPEFTSTGRVLHALSGDPVSFFTSQCGEDNPVANKYLGYLTIRTNLLFGSPIYYRIDFNTLGEYRVCQSIGNNTFTDADDREVKSL